MKKNKPDQVIGVVTRYVDMGMYPDVTLRTGDWYLLCQGSPILHLGDVVVLEQTDELASWDDGLHPPPHRGPRAGSGGW